MAKAFRIAIVGGGIGGLTLAVALRQRGIEADVYEQAQQLGEIGAAVALSANSTRELRRLGIGDALATVSTEPGELIYRNWRVGSRIAAHPVRENMNYQQICGAPYYGIHRADLQRILSGALGGAGLHLDHRLTEIRDLGGGALSAASCPWPSCRRCPIPGRSSSGWGRTRTCCTMQSEAMPIT
jgi:salicylate hydroxylase